MFADPDPPLEEYVVRPHADVVTDKTPSVETDEVEWNETVTDRDPNLGIENKTLASQWTEGVHTPPVNIHTFNTQPNYEVNKNISGAGYAASKESSGSRGPGTLSYAVGIEPVIRDGSAFGNEYFEAGHRDVQDGAGRYMTPDINDQPSKTQAIGVGKAAARSAAISGMYRALIERP
jgi:hypothetical protein